ncbi:MAG: O-antigen ligase family protein [Pseudomonadota bacterium]
MSTTADVIGKTQTTGQSPGRQRANAESRRFWFIPVFLVSLTIPYLFQAGPLQLSAFRLILIVMLFPCLYIWITGKAGAVRFADIALFLACFWTALSFFAVHGPAVAVEAGGIAFVETMGAYLIGRCFIRNADQFYGMVKTLFWIIVLMLPFAIYEALTSTNILLDLANKIAPSNDIVFKQPRLGLDRVQGVFSHPILFGIFCGGAPALVYYVLGYKTSVLSRATKTFLMSLAAFLSLSSGPLTALIAQFLLISWDRVLSAIKSRWLILSGGLLSMIVAIEIAANRSTPEIFISYFAFDTHTASNRLRIWQYGTLSVENYPFFGVGQNEWERPYYMSASLDMFWLVPAVRNGLPTALFLHAAFLALFLAVAFKSNVSERVSRYRTGYLICMVGFYLSGWTVNYWREIYVYFMFLMGSGAWILTADKGHDHQKLSNPERMPEAPAPDLDQSPSENGRQRNVYTRFPHHNDEQS